MKKLVSLVAVMAVVAMVSSSVFAEGIGFSKIAKATFDSVTAEFEAKVFTWVANKDFGSTTDYATEATQITFDTGKVTLGSTEAKWVVGKEFVRLSSNLTQLPANSVKILLRTKNKENNETGFNAKAATTDGMYEGLIRKTQGDTYVAGDHAPIDILCVKVDDANTNYKTALPTSFPIGDNYSYKSDEGHKGLPDFDNTNYDSAEEWLKLIAKSGTGDNGGIWIGSGSGEYGWWDKYSETSDVIMFLGATFQSVVSGDEFAAKIYFEQAAE